MFITLAIFTLAGASNVDIDRTELDAAYRASTIESNAYAECLSAFNNPIVPSETVSDNIKQAMIKSCEDEEREVLIALIKNLKNRPVDSIDIAKAYVNWLVEQQFMGAHQMRP